ncbi:unnamed protein product [Trichobilharzia szidati]|nr:unnamed protein product [Trichobilharzia szidati]
MWSRGPGSANLTTTSASSTGRKSQGLTVYDSRDRNTPNRGDISSASNSGQSSLHSTVNRPFPVNRNTTQSGDTSSVALSEASLSPNSYSNQQGTEPKSIQTVHSRFRQFWVETFVGGRSRTKSENQTPIQAEAHKVRFSDRLNEPTGHETDILPPHAYTITGDSSQAASILRPLAVYTNLSSPQSDQISPGFISSGTGSLRRLVSKHPRSGADGISITPPFSLFQQNDKFRLGKSTAGVKGRFVSTGNIPGKSSEDLYTLPKPSKLPCEQPISTLEFTTSKLKNPKKNFPLKTSLDVLRRKRAGSLSGRAAADRKSLTISPPPPPSLPRGFLLEHFSRSEENIPNEANKYRGKMMSQNINTGGVSSATSTSSVLIPIPNEISQCIKQNQSKVGIVVSGDNAQHHHRHHHGHHHNHNHHHHHHHHNHNHHHHHRHRNRGHLNHHGHSLTHTMTRVVESRRYLMFTKSLPFWSAKQYMETHGTGMGESETYAILFQHTPCYDLVPDSAKLLLLDSQLTIDKAFKALIYNGIRAAPVWNSESQSFISMLTVTDFVQMLNYCWNPPVISNKSDAKTMQIDDVDQMTIQKWKDIVIADRTHRLSLQLSSSTNKYFNKSMSKSRNSIALTTLWPPSNCVSSTSSSSSSSSSSSPSNSRSSSANSSSGRNLPTIKLSSSSSVSNQSAQNKSAKSTTDISNNNNNNNNSNNNNDHENVVEDGDGDETRANDTTTTTTTTTNNNSSNTLFQTSYTPGQTIFPSRLFICDPEESIFKALRLLLRFRLHHLPIMDSAFNGSGNILYVLTQRKLLSYMFEKLDKLPQPRFLQSSLIDLNIGTHGPVLMITPSTRLADAVLLFRDNYITTLPVVDSITNRRLINIFSKFDVFTLILNGAYKNPDLTIKEVLEICKGNIQSTVGSQSKPPVEVCLVSNNLLYVMEKLVKTGYRSLVIVNNTNEYRVDGIISISDVLRFTVLQQLRMTSTRLQPPSVAEVADEYDELKRNGESKKKKRGEKDKSGENLKATTNTTTTSNPPVSSSGCSSQTKTKKSSNKKSATTTTATTNATTPTTLGTTTSRNSPITTTITTATTKTPITITTVTGGVTSSPEHVVGMHSNASSAIHHEKKRHNAKGTKLDNSVKPPSDTTTTTINNSSSIGNDSRINKSTRQKVDNEKKITPPSVNIILTTTTAPTSPTTPTTHSSSTNLCPSENIILPTIVSEEII